MTVDEWVLEAVEALGRGSVGASLRQIQRHIDEFHYEELAIDTIETSLARLLEQGKVTAAGDRWLPAKKTSKEDALKKLFGE
jgi:hypothetical protein